MNLRQTAQHTAQLIGQGFTVRAVDQAGEQLVQLFEILVSEMNADGDDPGLLERAQVRQGEIPIGDGACAEDRIAVMGDQEHPQALGPGAQLGFRLAQAPVQVFLARPAGVTGDERLGRLVVLRGERGNFAHRPRHRDAVVRDGRATLEEIILAEESDAGRDAHLHSGQVDDHQGLAHRLLETIHRAGAIHQQVQRQAAGGLPGLLARQVRRVGRADFLPEGVAAAVLVRRRALVGPGLSERFGQAGSVRVTIHHHCRRL